MGKKTLICIIAIIVIIGMWAIGQYNSIVTTSEDVDSKWAQIDNQLLRRSDLIPDLVKVANKYAAYEKETIEAISNARSALMGASTVSEKVQANNEVSACLSRLIAISENYPDLKANEQYVALMDEMSGTENRIAVARKDYNDAVKEYNLIIKRFPGSIFAGMIGAEKKDFFEVSEESKVKPDYDL